MAVQRNLYAKEDRRWIFPVCEKVDRLFLSLILLPIKFAAILFLGFLGFYPMAKSFFERKFRGWKCLVLKFLLLNVCTVLMLLAARFVMAEALWLDVLTLVLVNVVFVIYDVALTRLLGMYVFVWRKKLKMKF